MLLAGSSPQARGKRYGCRTTRLPPRFIPAGAGKTGVFKDLSQELPVHPRRRGENAPPRGLRAARAPVHPRRRGENVVERVRDPPGVRFIPAGAGKTFPRVRWRGDAPVHPRRRGENASNSYQVLAGSPVHPRRRGENAVPDQAELRALRFIPAGAGKTQPVIGGCPLDCGSSPQARGKRVLRSAFFLFGRFIPAGAGKTTPLCASRLATKVHPRRRGENLGPGDALRAVARFIPAGAGKTR